MPKVSVIIPVYNVEPYLRECLDSVISQTLDDIEIICIDDCSTDQSLEILQEYAAEDPRIVLLQNMENSGQSVARNRGLEVATGEYIQFVDSDDCLVANALERLYSLAVTHDLDLIRPLVRHSNQTRGSTFEYSDEITEVVYTGPQLFFELEKNRTSYTATWLNFVKTACVRAGGIRFYPGINGEDTLLTLDIYIHARRCMCINEVIYIYRVGRPYSLTVSSASTKWLKSHVVLMEQIIKRLDRHPTDYQFRLAAVSLFCNHYNARFLRVSREPLNAEPESWDVDTASTYKMMYGSLDRYRDIREILRLAGDARVYIYGAGVMGERLINLLDLYDIPVAGVCVTDPSKGKKTLMGHRIQAIDEAQIDPERDYVLVTARKQYQTEMLETLHKKGIRHAIPCSMRRL